MNLFIDGKSEKPIYEQIFNSIRSSILSGELKGGDMLPSMRVLAKELRISIITTKRAYEELERAGYIESYPGRGSFVAELDQVAVSSFHTTVVTDKARELLEAAKAFGMSSDDVVAIIEKISHE